MKNENHIVIDGWMINELKLKGNELIIYALIYGFSQDEQSEFYGSRSYMAEWCNSSLPTVDKALNELISKKYIIKKVETINNVTFNRYKINLEVVKNLYRGSKETLGEVVKNLYRGSKETLYNSIEYNIKDNIEDNNITTTDTIFDFLEKNGFVLTPIHYEIIQQWEDTELTRYAIKQAVLNNKFNINYIDKIIYSYKKDNIQTVQQAIEREEKFNIKRNLYYKKKYELKENRHEREKRILEEMFKDEED